MLRSLVTCLFFFNDTATTEIYTLSLHDALPICDRSGGGNSPRDGDERGAPDQRSEEHTSELQSPCNLGCRLLLAKKKKSRHLTSSRQTQTKPTYYPTRQYHS